MTFILDKIAKTANFANWAIIHDIHALHPSHELPSSPASRLKNAFKPVFQQVLEEGVVSITRNRRREVVVMSAELYDQIIVELASRDPLEVLRKDYDPRFAKQQTDEAKGAFQKRLMLHPKSLARRQSHRRVNNGSADPLRSSGC